MRDFTLFHLTAVTLFIVAYELSGVIAPPEYQGSDRPGQSSYPQFPWYPPVDGGQAGQSGPGPGSGGYPGQRHPTDNWSTGYSNAPAPFYGGLYSYAPPPPASHGYPPDRSYQYAYPQPVPDNNRHPPPPQPPPLAHPQPIPYVQMQTLRKTTGDMSISEADDEELENHVARGREIVSPDGDNGVKYNDGYLRKMMARAQKHAEECLMVCLSQRGYIAGIYDSDNDSCHCLMHGEGGVINEIPLLEKPTRLINRGVCTLFCKFQTDFYHRGEYLRGNNNGDCKCFHDDSAKNAGNPFPYISQEEYLEIR